MQASLTLGKYVMMAEGVPGVGGYMANDHKAKAITGTQTSAHEGSAAHGNHSGSSCTLSDTFAAQMMVDGLAGLIAGLQVRGPLPLALSNGRLDSGRL